MSQQLRNTSKLHIPTAVLHQMQQPRGEDFGLGYELLKFVDKSLKHWDGDDHLNTLLADHIKVFDERGGMIEKQNCGADGGGSALISIGAAILLAAIAGPTVYCVPLSSSTRRAGTDLGGP